MDRFLDFPQATATPFALIAIIGPTGAGKSTLALDLTEGLAGTIRCEIVNCDSVQFYRGFDIGTAKTPVSERRDIPHHLFDVRDAQDGYSAGDYARQARDVITGITARGCLPIVVGGTGFYLHALLDGLPQLPSRDESLRNNLVRREQRRPGSLHRLLGRLEPGAASRIHPRDVQKLMRALEVRLLTRRELPSPESAEPLRDYRILKIGLNPDRSLLVGRLEERVRIMFAGGLVEEVRGMLARGATGREKPFESLGYKQALALLRGETTLEEAIASTQIETRQYAKRQLTWFRRDPAVEWLQRFGDDPQVVEQALQRVREFL